MYVSPWQLASRASGNAASAARNDEEKMSSDFRRQSAEGVVAAQGLGDARERNPISGKPFNASRCGGGGAGTIRKKKNDL